MKKMMSHLMIMVLVLGSFEAFASKKATTIESQDDDGKSITLTKCTAHDACTDPNEGCYEADSDEFEGAGWWTKMWRRENGKTCTADKQCDSGNCDDFNETDGTDDKGNTKWKVVQRCGPLSVCKQAEYGDSIRDVAATCSAGLVADLDGKCISADMFDLDDSLAGTATEVAIDLKSCSVQVPPRNTLSYRYNTMMIQLLTFIFRDVQFNDCIGVTPGIGHIARTIEAAQVAYGNQVISGLKQQEAYYNEHIKDTTDSKNKAEVDAYNASLEVMKMNQESYKAANDILIKAYDAALLDLGTIQTMYSNYDWKHDPVGNKAPQNNSAGYNLTSGGGFKWNIAGLSGDSLHNRKNYCRSKSPKLKRGFYHRYRAFDGTHNGLADYLSLNYSNLADSHDEHSNEKAYFLVDPPQPRLNNSGIVLSSKNGNVFKAFGTTASTRDNKDDSEHRVRISKDLIEYMLDVYLVEMYRVFKDKPEFLAQSTSQTSGATGGAVQLVGVTDADKVIVDNFHKSLLGVLNQNHNSTQDGMGGGNDKKYWDQGHGDEGKLNNNEKVRKDILAQYFHVSTRDKRETVDPAKYFMNRTGTIKMDPQLKALLDYTLTMGLSDQGKKSVIKFHLLMHDLRQRFYQVMFLYSANRKKTYPLQMRNLFWDVFQSAFNSNLKYLNDLNEKGHQKSIECLIALKGQWQKETGDPEGDDNFNASNYDPKNPGKKFDKGTVGQYGKKCLGKECTNSMSVNIAIPKFGTKGVKDGEGGVGQRGNLSGADVQAGSVGQAAIARIRKKKEEDFNKKASPAMKKAREEGSKYIKLTLTAPPAFGGGDSAPMSSASSGGGSSTASGDSAVAKEQAPVEVAMNAPIGGAPAPALNSISVDKDLNSGSHAEITPEHAEVLLSEVKDDKYKSDENDNIFVKITKTYLRAGLPRLLPKKAEIKNEDQEAFDPTVKKKKTE